MSQMYAILEDVVGPLPNSIFSDAGDKEEKKEEGYQPTGNVTSSSFTAQARTLDSSGLQNDTKSTKSTESSVSPNGSPCVIRKRKDSGNSPQKFQQHESHYVSSTMPKSRRRKENNTSYATSSNPLLDTISVLTYDPCDSDDYYDFSSIGETEVTPPVQTKSSEFVISHPVDGDRESIGYAGSNSIDSGYKSFCPTPEIPDSSVYGANCTRGTVCSTNSSLFYTDSSGVSHTVAQENGKAKSAMGVKILSRPGSRDSGSRRSDSSLYEVNLDHLMYLRQSLLSAIQKCESYSSKSADAASCTKAIKKDSPEKKRDKSKQTNSCDNSNDLTSSQDSQCNDTSRSLTTNNQTVHSSLTTPSYHKTVRFNTDVKISALNNIKNNSERDDANLTSTNAPINSDSSNNYKQKDKDFQPNSRYQSKSILKDPLCANLRSKLEAEAPDFSLEEEIDSLLYGRAEFYDLENVDDFPCSYVTMIEEKYRSGKPSIAKVRKLKGEKSQDFPKTATGTEQKGDGSEETEKNSNQASSSSPRTKTINSATKCRFTEVARCMLEIIEDLQIKKLQMDASKTTKDSSQPTCSRVLPQSVDSQHEDANDPDENRHSPAVDDTPQNIDSSSCYASAMDYHVYEEIVYDFAGNSGQKQGQSSTNLVRDIPPPLPARPTALMQKLEQNTSKNPSRSTCNSSSTRFLPPPPPVLPQQLSSSRKSRCFRRSVNEGSVRNRPKQRSNLYSLFADRTERRNISRSLERESYANGKDDLDDEYGFKKLHPRS